jgi:uncharacterized membrane protein
VTAWIVAIGRMLGLGSIAGIRPSLTLAVIGVVGYFDLGVHPNSSFSWLGYWWVIGIFVVLAILESTFDKISKLDRLQDRLIMPYRLGMGGVAGAATAPFGWQGIVAGAAIGAGAAWFAQYTKHLSRPRSVPSEAVVTLISAVEDLGAFLGSVLVLAVPYSGYAAVGVTGFVYWRVRDRRRSKYKKMRRTAQAAPRAVSGSSRTNATGSPDGAGAAATAHPHVADAAAPRPVRDEDTPPLAEPAGLTTVAEIRPVEQLPDETSLPTRGVAGDGDAR